MGNSKEYFEGVGLRDFVGDIIEAINKYFELPNGSLPPVVWPINGTNLYFVLIVISEISFHRSPLVGGLFEEGKNGPFHVFSFLFVELEDAIL
jgi:hypothetical protein